LNTKHLKAILWLRWRILRNRAKRSGKASNAFFIIVMGLISLFTVGSFSAALLIGIEAVPDTAPYTLMLVWAGLGLGFLFMWTIGLLADLQRSDAMSFKNLLHLPVSLRWVFLYNYLSSFVCLSVVVFLPPLVGLCLAMVIVEGPIMLLSFLLLAGFFGMITAITYQLRGWLARLMENKRRARNIISAMTLMILVLAQAPNLINMSMQQDRMESRSELRELKRLASTDGPDQAQAQLDLTQRTQADEKADAILKANISVATLVLPIGWMPYGMRALALRRWFAACLCAFGMFSIAGWSLLRSYRKTLQGVLKGERTPKAQPSLSSKKARQSEPPTGRKKNFVERPVPFVSQRIGAIARTSLLSFIRAPEAKLLVLSPIILLGFYGYLLRGNASSGSFGGFSSLLSLGAITIGMVSVMQILQNQFGLDREGFRAYLLSPTPRSEILMGKNIAIAPVGLGVGLAALILLQFLMPMDASHFAGACFQLGSAYLLMCLLCNMLSIVCPIRLKDNALKPANSNWKSGVIHLFGTLMVPITMSPLLIPGLVEFFLSSRGSLVFFGLHLSGLIASFIAYRWLITKQGTLLKEREQRILDVLTHD
jgi:ABC-2 type transport system permease protein